jgi:hypothetical protein
VSVTVKGSGGFCRRSGVDVTCGLGVVMVVSRVVHNEVVYWIRTLLASVPPLRAPAEQRSNFQLFKAEALDWLAATEPCAAAQAMQLAAQARARARHETRAIILDY